MPTPQNLYHCWLVGEIAVISLQIERLNRIERRERDRFVLQSQLFWDDDRRIAAEVLGQRLAEAPAIVVNQLGRTPQGC